MWCYSLYSITGWVSASPDFVGAVVLRLPSPHPASWSSAPCTQGVPNSVVTADLSPPSSDAPQQPQILVQPGQRPRTRGTHVSLLLMTKPARATCNGTDSKTERDMLLPVTWAKDAPTHQEKEKIVDRNTGIHGALLVQRALLTLFSRALLPLPRKE